MNKVMKAAMALAIVLGLAVCADAGTKDSLMVTITPNVYYAVLISTGNVGLNLGTVELKASTQTVNPSTVTIQSSYAKTELKLEGAIAHSGAGTEWTFSIDSTTYETDKLAAWAVFTDTSVVSAPSQSSGYFNGTEPGADADLIGSAQQHVGETGGSGTRFLAGIGDSGYKPMDAIPNDTTDLAASRSHLWLMFRLPGGSTSPDAQNITLTLTAVQEE